MRPRSPLLLLAVLAPLALMGAVPRAASAGTIEARDHNFIMDLPPGWEEEPAKGSWEKDGIRRGARRLLTKLDDGKPATGQAGHAHVSVTEAPAGKTLADLAQDPSQREFLTRYFGKGGPAEVKSEDTRVKNEALNAEVPAVRLLTHGTALTEAGTEMPCTGLLIVAIAKKKLYRLRLLAWTTPNDEEQLRTDLDAVDIGFVFVDLSEEKPPEKPKDPKDPDGPGPGGKKPVDENGEPIDGDADKELPIVNPIEGWKAKKPKKLSTQEIDLATAPYRKVFLRGNDSLGNCDLTMDVYPNKMITDGKQTPPLDIKKMITTSWWQQITSTYAEGPLAAYPWPRGRNPFLGLPALDGPPKELWAAPKDRPKSDEMDAAAILKKFAEEVKNAAVGKVKVDEAYRGSIRGNRPRSGPEIVMRWVWRSEEHTFLVYVSIGREGLKRYLTPVKEFLESLEITK